MGEGARTGRARLALVVVTGVLVALAIAHRAALGDLRDVERAYVEGRQITACATAALSPFASRERDVDELPGALEELIVDARGDVVALVEAFPDAMSWWLRSPAARDAVADALDAERALYEAMVDDPAGSDDELEELGTANRRAEDALESARGALLVDAGAGWNERNRCRS